MTFGRDGASVSTMPANPLTDPTWANTVTDQIVSTIGTVRDKTTNNAIKAVRGIVFGLLATILGIVAVVLLLIMLTRGLQNLLAFGLSEARAVYVSYLIIGVLLTVVGLALMKKRSA